MDIWWDLLENEGGVGASGDGGAAVGNAGDSEGGTTTDNVEYLPSGFGRVKQKLKSLSKKKIDWVVDIKELDERFSVNFENVLCISVAKDLWESFVKDLRLDIREGVVVLESRDYIDENKVRLSWLIEEEAPVAIKEACDRVSLMLQSVISPGIECVDRQVGLWESVFDTGVRLQAGPSLIKGALSESISEYLRNEYEDDLGGLECFEWDLERGCLDNLICESIFSCRIQDVSGLIYEVLLDRELNIKESVLGVGKRLDESLSGVRVVGNGLILPEGRVFSEDSFKNLKNICGLEE